MLPEDYDGFVTTGLSSSDDERGRHDEEGKFCWVSLRVWLFTLDLTATRFLSLSSFNGKQTHMETSVLRDVEDNSHVGLPAGRLMKQI